MHQRLISLFAIALLVLVSFTNSLAQDIPIIKKRIVGDLLEPSVNKTAITQLVKTLQPDGTWPGINYKDVSRTGFQHRDHLENMLSLARAYKKPGSPFLGDPAVKKTFSAALDFWLANDFRCDNWWWNEMGTPNLMINTLLVMDSSLTEKQRVEGLKIAHRANLETFGARPGGDLMPIAGMLGKQALFNNDPDTLQRVIRVMAEQVKITTDRGIKPDLSFHHRTDNVTSILTYGTNFASSFAYWASRIGGTQFSFPEPAMKLLVDYYLDGICQSLIYATYPDPGTMNRDISRRNALGKVDIGLPQNLLAATNYRSEELNTIIRVRKGEIKYNRTRDRYFWYSHYYSHQRPDYFASVRMHSARASNMEQPHNEEGIRNHHYGDGSLFISRTGQEYFNIFPVWDWQKIPGTTILQKANVSHWNELAKKGLTDFAGGVSDGAYGVAAFDFASVHDPLKARKSWFFFDNEIVCLGAGIHADAALPVFTTLNQCLLNGEVIAGANNKSSALKTGDHKLPGVSWVYHDSVAYIFPQPASVNVSNREATGNWRLINHQASASTETVRKDVFTLWLDHGVQPQNADYAWIVVPAIDAVSTAAYSKKAPVKILANTADLQAVQQTDLQRTGIVFYKAGSVKINDKLTLTATAPCIVMVKGNGTAIAVADPTQKLSALQLKLNERIINVTLPKDDKAGSTVIVQ
ncbi:chondroitin lyase [Chitinophaga sp. SYP-B3965]|uniref:polysaccharide lyase family 8 super-sandwich domain-containing protein n=1 Tax=Chitinophaga sp. SYP-B3965 TaxID=2663120 RepID=UPI001299E6CF|nr:polysaccharide lyase family 8 super-sandwich domain-containing protein [Chitinophaga sp. SYP-B3965]MRG48304.1 chondroitin lyase [Chitinophaga sp. SYP-B3965]